MIRNDTGDPSTRVAARGKDSANPLGGDCYGCSANGGASWHPVVVKILLVEDDDSIAGPLAKGLEREGYSVNRVANGRDALAATGAEMILLDLGLPDIDGLDVCRRLRSTSDVPIIVVSARGEEIDRVLGLELGADDYLVKPFSVRELVARIRAILRRMASEPSSSPQSASSEEVVQRIGDLELDRRTHRVRLGEHDIDLTPKEFALLALLAEDPGALRTRAEILDQVWDPNWYGPTKTLDVHVASLRKKLGDPAWIETVRGVGFRLRADDGS
jgi:two-component system, OmpR family, response regulator RegX3